MRNVLLKNVDVLFTSQFIKVNVPSIKYFAVIDFANEIDSDSQKNRV